MTLTLLPPARNALQKGIALGKIRREAAQALAQQILAEPERYPELIATAQTIAQPTEETL